MNTHIKASVILPIYNSQQYLAQAIDSVLAQTWPHFEVLLLNDGSTDNSEAIIDDFCQKDSRCRKFSSENKGLIDTLNEGIEFAKSEIIIRMDADDICHPERFEKQWQYLNANPDCVAVGCRILMIDDEDLPISEFPCKESHNDIDRTHMLGYGGAIAHPTAMIRKQALLSINGYRSDYKHAEDIDLFLRLAEEGQLANIPETLFYYRQHASSISYMHSETQAASALAAIADAKSRRGIETTETPSISIDSPSIEEVYRKWAWWAFKSGNKQTAKKYTFKAIKEDPFNYQNFKLLVALLRS